MGGLHQHWKSWNLAVAQVGVVLTAAAVEAKPTRSGFTGELSGGLAHTSFSETYYEDVSDFDPETRRVSLSGTRRTRWDFEFGLAPLALEAGWFLNGRLSVGLRLAGTTFSVGSAYNERTLISAYYGPVVEHWLGQRLFLGGGVGLGLLGRNSVPVTISSEPEFGMILNARFGFAPVTWDAHGLFVALDAYPGFYPDNTVLGTALNAGWKWY